MDVWDLDIDARLVLHFHCKAGLVNGQQKQAATDANEDKPGQENQTKVIYSNLTHSRCFAVSHFL